MIMQIKDIGCFIYIGLTIWCIFELGQLYVKLKLLRFINKHMEDPNCDYERLLCMIVNRL